MKTYVGKPQTLKKVNENIVLNKISISPGISQAQITETTGLSLQTVNKTVRCLEAKGDVICSGISTYTGGRRAKIYEVNENKGFIVCIYIQGTQFHCKVTNIIGKEINSNIYERKITINWIDNLLEILDKITRGVEIPKIEIIGIAVPGTVTKGHIYNIPAIPEWEGLNLETIIRQKFPCRVLIENDIKSATMGACSEYLHTDNQNMAYISILDHIGSAIIINRNLYSSRNNFAGELAYMAVNESEKGENQCGCADNVLAEALSKKDKNAIQLLAVQLLVNICCVVDPDLVVLATPYIERKDILILKEKISRYIQKEYIPEIVIDDVIPEKNLDGIVSICRNRIEAAVQIIKA